MKRKSVVILMCVLFASLAFAQFELGVKLGANYSYIESEDFAFQEYIEKFGDLGNITGFVGGIVTGYKFGSFGIQAEGLFSMEGFSIQDILEGEEDALEGTTIRTNYLNAVLAARYNLNLFIVKPYVLAGVNVGIPLGDSVVEGSEIDLEDFDFTKLGLAFGVGIKIFDMVDVEVRYVQGITDIYQPDDDTNDPTFSNLIRLSLGLYIF